MAAIMNQSASNKKLSFEDGAEQKRTIRLIAILGVGWTVFLVLFFVWSLQKEYQQAYDVLQYQARAFFEEVVTTRSWNSSHGGVYVPVTDKTQPNPYLKMEGRDVITQKGLKLTKINPAYMTRQIGELAAKRTVFVSDCC